MIIARNKVKQVGEWKDGRLDGWGYIENDKGERRDFNYTNGKLVGHLGPKYNTSYITGIRLSKFDDRKYKFL